MAASASSSTSSRTSRRSSTSDGRRRLTGLVRLVHPFPSLLNGVIAAAVALVAGGGWLTSLRLGLAMVALQFSIGTLNDLLDADRDAGPDAAQADPRRVRVGPDGARRVGRRRPSPGCSSWSRPAPPTLVVAALGLGIGYAYDRFGRGTAWSWLPFALGIPLVPVYGWIGTGEPLPWIVRGPRPVRDAGRSVAGDRECRRGPGAGRGGRRRVGGHRGSAWPGHGRPAWSSSRSRSRSCWRPCSSNARRHRRWSGSWRRWASSGAVSGSARPSVDVGRRPPSARRHGRSRRSGWACSRPSGWSAVGS